MLERSLSEWCGTNFVMDPTWGDNGKGKIVDLMAQRAQMVVKTNGGPNAGHTVVNEHGEFALHLVPSGIFNPDAVCVLSDTVVINPTSLVAEIESVRKSGVEINSNNFLISMNAHLIMPWHRKRDGLREVARGEGKIGTTGQGVGPTYSDRTDRVGLRVRDLIEPGFEEKFDKELRWQEKLTALMSGSDSVNYDREKILEELVTAREVIAPMVTEVLPVIWEYHDSGKNVLGEAGQGVLLDLDRGGYPYVTSSHPGIAGFNLATGISPREVDRVIAVTKAYSTRVGEGPLPTELLNEMGDKIREKGDEYGTTTARPRRCGWLDIPTLRYGVRVGGADSLALTKIDIFDEFSEVKICTGHEIDGVVYKTIPTADNHSMSRAKPIFETLPGWEKTTTGCRDFKDLPKNARRFVQRIQEIAGIPIELVSVGPEREASIYTDN